MADLAQTVHTDEVPQIVAELTRAFALEVKVRDLVTPGGIRTDFRILSVPLKMRARVEDFLLGWRAYRRAEFERHDAEFKARRAAAAAALAGGV